MNLYFQAGVNLYVQGVNFYVQGGVNEYVQGGERICPGGWTYMPSGVNLYVQDGLTLAAANPADILEFQEGESYTNPSVIPQLKAWINILVASVERQNFFLFVCVVKIPKGIITNVWLYI